MDEILKILLKASNCELPDNINENSIIDINRFKSLVDDGYIEAIDASDSDGLEYIDPQITISGREFLEKYIKEETTKSSQRFQETDGWEIIEENYGISKLKFGKKINFIEDRKIRKIIFRDTAQAFLLESQGYFKPAIILSGGIIEELLRNYLHKKELVPKRNTLDEYINTCKENKILGNAIVNMGHYVRLMRNLVHIQRESKDETIIDQALAKGIISTIITITNSFTN